METPGELTEEDKDFLKSLETMAAEIDGEADPSPVKEDKCCLALSGCCPNRILCFDKLSMNEKVK
jgi:hypothetical protein